MFVGRQKDVRVNLIFGDSDTKEVNHQCPVRNADLCDLIVLVFFPFSFFFCDARTDGSRFAGADELSLLVVPPWDIKYDNLKVFVCVTVS